MALMFIDGVEAAAIDGADLPVVNPTDGRPFDTVPDASAADVNAAVQAAARAFTTGPWPAMPRTERATLLTRSADAIEAVSEQLHQLETRNNGRPVSETQAQLTRVPEWFRYNAALLLASRDAVTPSDGPYLMYQRREPLGVCGIITPFNHPLLILARSLSAALATGNTVVIKPSELTPLTTLLLVKTIHDTRIPPGVVNVVTGGRTAGAALVEHPDVAKINITGGTEAGRSAAVATAARFARITAELGGKTPVIVFDDIEPEVSAEGAAFAAYIAAGQSCIAGAKFLVQRGCYNRFVAALAERATRIRVGDPSDARTQMGPLVSRAQLEKTLRYIAIGRDEGATLSAGGTVPDLAPGLSSGFFVSPTVLSDADTTMRIAREEIFGPVAVVIPFDDEAEAVALANDNRFGLGAALWTRDVARAHRVAAAIQSGMVWVNDHHRIEPSLPWGGIKESGSGRDAGVQSFDDFTWIKTVIVRTAPDDVSWHSAEEPGRLN